MAYIRVYVGHSCILEHTRPPLLPYKFNQQFLIVGFAGLVLAPTLLPNDPNAFWPFLQTPMRRQIRLFKRLNASACCGDKRESNAGAPIAFAVSSGSALVPYGGHADTAGDITNVPPPDRISVYPVRSGSRSRICEYVWRLSHYPSFGRTILRVRTMCTRATYSLSCPSPASSTPSSRAIRSSRLRERRR